jgi:NAD dependent epimerase/dehydratase family enzyme
MQKEIAGAAKARAGCGAPLGSARQWINWTNAPACVAMLMMS